MNPDKLFTVTPRTAEDAPKAKILEDLINAPKFREAIIHEFEARAKELVRSIMDDSMYPMLKYTDAKPIKYKPEGNI